MSCDVLVVGGINTDFVARGDTLPSAGESRHGELFSERPGGKGANQAVAAARLGVRVALIGAIGNDSRARRLLAHLRDRRIDVSSVSAVRGYATGAALIHLDRRGKTQIMAVLGANRRLEAADVARAIERIGHARVVLAQLEVPLAAATEALAWGRRIGAQTVLDPAPVVPLPEDVLRLVDVIRPNAAEAEALTGVHVRDRESARQAARVLLRSGAACAIVQGGEGNLLVSNDHERWLPHIDVESVDATGAGDAFTGTLAACLAKGLAIDEAAELATAAAAWETTAVGAESPDVSEEQLRALAASSTRADLRDVVDRKDGKEEPGDRRDGGDRA